MEKQFKNVYISNMVREINKEIKKGEEKELFFFIKIYVKAMKIIEKLLKKKKKRLKEKLTAHHYNYFCKKMKNFFV